MHSSKSASNDRANRFQQLVLAHYIPEAVLHKIESTAQYDPVREEWLVIRLNFAGNVLRARYPERYASTKEGAAALEMHAGADDDGGGGGGGGEGCKYVLRSLAESDGEAPPASVDLKWSPLPEDRRVGVLAPALAVETGAVFEGCSGIGEYLLVEATGPGLDGVIHPQVQLRGVGVLVLIHLTL